MRTIIITRNLTVLFFVVAILDIIGIVAEISMLQIVSKPLIILTLITLYYFSALQRSSLYLIALLFSLLGDVFLLNKTNYFLLGIASFLITQIVYSILIIRLLNKSTMKQKLLASFPFIIFLSILISVLGSNLDEYFFPVIIYGIAISIFGILSLLNYQLNRTKSSRFLLVGAVLFIISDSMIALNKFHEQKAFYPVAVMATYILAQYFIYKFMVKTDFSKK